MRIPSHQLVPPGRWCVEPERSTVRFAIKHMLVATVRGSFTEFEGAIEGSNGATRASGLVRAGSIETGMPERDAHLRGDGFLAADEHPEISFDSRRVEPDSAEGFWVIGDLAIAGTSQPVRLHVTAQRLDGSDRIRLAVRGNVKRSAFGIVPKSLLEAGVADQVDVELDLCFARREAVRC